MGARGKEGHRQDGVVAWGWVAGREATWSGAAEHTLDARPGHGVGASARRKGDSEQDSGSKKSRAFMGWGCVGGAGGMGGYLVQRKVIEVGSWQGLTGFLSSPLSWGSLINLSFSVLLLLYVCDSVSLSH